MSEQSRYFRKMQDEPRKKSCPAIKWTKRAGIIAFLFFLGKGLLWLGILAVGAYYALN